MNAPLSRKDEQETGWREDGRSKSWIDYVSILLTGTCVHQLKHKSSSDHQQKGLPLENEMKSDDERWKDVDKGNWMRNGNDSLLPLLR